LSLDVEPARHGHTTGTNVQSLTYAADGSITDDTRDPSNDYGYTYNDASRLVTAKLNGTAVGSYVYNALEERAAKTASGSTIQFVYDRAGHLIEEADASTGAALREYIWLDDMPVALIDHSGMSPMVYYIHADQLNRPQKITDGSAAVVWDGVFDPFGNPTSVTGTVAMPLRFPGQYVDPETALNQNWFRYYDPSIGRYVESDPIGLAGGINTYAYVNGSPILGYDQAGTGPVGGTIGEIIGGAFGGALGSAAEPGGGTAYGAYEGAEAGYAVGSTIEELIYLMTAKG
ncbi:MAG: hypothetical protein JSR60_00710, partial [Proteobacteria bacterium]|nr:hypothetical protein [Pseudomonadota bacterium]